MRSLIALLFFIPICSGFITCPVVRHNPNLIKMNLFNRNISASEAQTNQKYAIKFVGLNIYQFILMKHFHIYFPLSYVFANFLYDQTLEFILILNKTKK
jgi:hypothetical protein